MIKLILEENKIRIRLLPEDADALLNEQILTRKLFLPSGQELTIEVSPCKFPKPIEEKEGIIRVFVDFMQLQELQVPSKKGVLLTKTPVDIFIEIDMKQRKPDQGK